MPRSRTTITSERARELGRRGAAAVERDPVTHRFVKRKQPEDAPSSPPEEPTPVPASDPPEEPTPAPSFRVARGIFRRRR